MFQPFLASWLPDSLLTGIVIGFVVGAVTGCCVTVYFDDYL